MFDHLLAHLRDTLSPHFNLRKTRLEAMAAIMLGLGELPDCEPHTSGGSFARQGALQVKVSPFAALL